jgi:hypothetical protein
MMDRNQALDDLKAIRQIMGRTQREAGKPGGWSMVIAGVMCLIGFSATQFLPDGYINWTWAAISIAGTGAMIWIAARSTRRSGVRTPLWWPIFLFWWALAGFDVLLIWLFDVTDGIQIGLVILLTVATGYAQLGLLYHWLITAVGILIGILSIGTFFLAPDYFPLAMGILGGGMLIGSGLRMARPRK